VKPRNVFNLGVGTDNLFHREGHTKVTASFEIANLANKWRSTTSCHFSGTHFLRPRSAMARLGWYSSLR